MYSHKNIVKRELPEAITLSKVPNRLFTTISFLSCYAFPRLEFFTRSWQVWVCWLICCNALAKLKTSEESMCIATSLCPVPDHFQASKAFSNSPGQTPRSSRLATVWIVLEDSFGRQLDDICWVCWVLQYVYVVVCLRSRWECWLGRHGWLACGMPRGLVPLVFLVAGKTGDLFGLISG